MQKLLEKNGTRHAQQAAMVAEAKAEATAEAKAEATAEAKAEATAEARAGEANVSGRWSQRDSNPQPPDPECLE